MAGLLEQKKERSYPLENSVGMEASTPPSSAEDTRALQQNQSQQAYGPVSLQQQQNQIHSFLLLDHLDSFGDEWSHFVEDDDNDEEEEEKDEEYSVTIHREQRTVASHQQNEETSPRDIIIELPPLHPAVSEGMKKISSCYFSVRSASSGNHISSNSMSGSSIQCNGSLVDILTFLDCHDDESIASWASQQQNSLASASEGHKHYEWNSAQDLLYHDILMHIFGFLDTESLAAFSETARKPNFETFYFLQLQLQRSLVPANSNSFNGHITGALSPLAGTGRLARLARTDYKAAEEIVHGYLDSNASLRQMPLSHSLIRALFLMRRNHQQQQRNPPTPTPQERGHEGSPTSQHQLPQRLKSMQLEASMLSRAALLVALIGAASYTMNAETVMANMDAFMPPAAELPNMLFRVGFVGSLMSAARSFASPGSGNRGSNNSRSMKQQAEQFGRNLMKAFSLLLQEEDERQHQHAQNNNEGRVASTMTSSVRSMMVRMMRAAYSTAYGHDQIHRSFRNNAAQQRFQLFSPNPYDHLPTQPEEEEDDSDSEKNEDNNIESKTQEHCLPSTDEDSNISELSSAVIPDLKLPKVETKDPPPAKRKSNSENQAPPPCRKTPTGCVGSYRRAISQATKRLVDLVKEERLRNYKALNEEEQRRLGTALLDACGSDDGLQQVKTIIKQGIDVEDFYVASDGTETSALHAAAFHGASAVLEYLCQGLADDDDPLQDDGGLCQVNLKDSNGWTALHFAAGAQSTESIRILAAHGADLMVEAANGYTPLHWAIRLQNTAVAEELRQLLSERGSFVCSWGKNNPSDLSRFFFGVVESH